MGFVQEAAVYLGSAVLVVPLSKRLGFGSVLGYLAAGVVIGPWVSGLIDDPDAVLHVAEFGVVLLLFIIGLELQPSRLRVLRKTVFGFGTAQVVITGAVLTFAANGFGVPWAAAFIIGFGLSLSSTAFVLQLLAERREMTTAQGRNGFGVLLFQDIAVIPLIAMVPLLAPGPVTDSAGAPTFLSVLTAVSAIGAFVIGGRFALRHVLGIAAGTGLQEVFTAASLLLVVGAALLMNWLGLSMGLGAFVAGVLVADSPYRKQLETDIEPFKGLLLGLFFIAVGMSANLELLASETTMVLGLTAALIAIKSFIVLALARIFGLPWRNAIAMALLLSQGGEFAFVLFSLSSAEGLIDNDLSELLILVVTLSMVATPFLYALQAKLLERPKSEARPFDVPEKEQQHVVIAGFGRFGQIIGRMLSIKQIPFTALEINPTQVDFVRRYGNKIYYGDATRLDILRTAELGEARALVIAVDDVDAAVKIAELAKTHFPEVLVFARARNRVHAFRLIDAGVSAQIRDTLLSSVELATQLLHALGLTLAQAQEVAHMFRRHDEETLMSQYALAGDEQALIQSSKDAAKQLRELFELDTQSS